jgi:hypothetical protein
MLGPIMAQIVVPALAQHEAVVAEEACLPDIAICGPARRAEGRDTLGLPGPPERTEDSRQKPIAPVAPASMPAFEKICGA